MKMSWQHTDGEWRTFPDWQVELILHQQSDRALLMLASYRPVVMEHEGGYICTKNLYPNIKRKHRNCVTFDTLLHKLKTDEMLYETLKIDRSRIYTAEGANAND